MAEVRKVICFICKMTKTLKHFGIISAFEMEINFIVTLI